MKILAQAGIIFLFTFLGEVLARLIPLPIPTAIWGLLLLFLALSVKWIRPEQIRETSGFLVATLPALFVAPAVNLMDQAGTVLGILPQLAVIVAVSSAVTFLVTGRVTQGMRCPVEERQIATARARTELHRQKTNMEDHKGGPVEERQIATARVRTELNRQIINIEEEQR